MADPTYRHADVDASEGVFATDLIPAVVPAGQIAPEPTCALLWKGFITGRLGEERREAGGMLHMHFSDIAALFHGWLHGAAEVGMLKSLHEEMDRIHAGCDQGGLDDNTPIGGYL